jgi:glutathione peroxidase
MTHRPPPPSATAPARRLFAVGCLVALTGCGWNDVRKPEQPAPAASTSATAAGLAAREADPLALSVEAIDGQQVALSSYRGKAVLIVNTASECGLTPQYAGLQALHERYGPRGLAVLGFPCNDFGGQEPGSAEEIQTFCTKEFSVTFPLFAKVRAKGDDISPLYRILTEATPAGIRGPIKWNFTKFLIDPDGKVVARFEPAVKPDDPRLIEELERVLPQQAM